MPFAGQSELSSGNAVLHSPARQYLRSSTCPLKNAAEAATISLAPRLVAIRALMMSALRARVARGLTVTDKSGLAVASMLHAASPQPIPEVSDALTAIRELGALIAEQPIDAEVIQFPGRT